MADLLTDHVLPVLGLCPPGVLLLPWLASARSATGLSLGLPQGVAATFAIARRVAERVRGEKGQAPVAAVLLEEPVDHGPAPAYLVMIDWAHELGPWSSAALRSADPRMIFGSDARISRRVLLSVTKDDAQPFGLLRSLSQSLSINPEEIGWLGMRALYECLADYLRRVPRERHRAPERTAAELLMRLSQAGIRPWHRVLPAPDQATALAPSVRIRRRYEPRRPGTREFPWSFAPRESVFDEALVMGALLSRRREQRQAVALSAALSASLSPRKNKGNEGE